jgi:hypothetical protein
VIDLVPVLAHGLTGRADLPIPAWLFAWAAGAVLVVSFVLLGALWKTPRLEGSPRRSLPHWLSGAVTNRVVEILCGTLGVFLLCVTIWAGFAGVNAPGENFGPTFVFVIFWVGLVAVSALFGDVFRAFNPWRAVGRAAGWVVALALPGRLEGALPYPDRLGRWPAAAGLFAFVWLELASPTGAEPRTLAAAVLVYTCVTFLGMGIFGVDSWIDRGEAFSTYFNLFSRMAVFERRGREIVLRRPLAGLTDLVALPGTVAVLAVMIGTLTFDGLQETSVWAEVGVRIADFFQRLGAGFVLADELASGIGAALMVGLVAGFYGLAIRGARTVGGDFGQGELSGLFVHTLVPIAFAYSLAHYMTFLIFQGQAMGFLVSDPLGNGRDLFGTADWSIDLTVIGATVTWYCQVAVVVAGHVGGLILAHDRALVLYDDPRAAVRSQYWMLAVMIGFTSLALWLLSQANV